MDIVLGIDGGGTKTAAIILSTQGRVLGYGEGGPSTYGVVPAEVTQASIAYAVRAATERAGIQPEPFEAVFLGLGNVVSEADRAAVRAIALAMGLAGEDRTGVDHDIRVALAGGLAGRPGIVLIAGTGTSCYGINAEGASWRAGGWGPLIDDEGSSYWLGIQAMRAAALEADGRGTHTLLTGSVRKRLGLEHMDDLMNRLYAAEMTRTAIATLAPLVIEAAGQGDVVAQELIRRGCGAMAECVLAVARKIGFDRRASELAVSGGLTNAGETILRPLRVAIKRHLPRCQVKQAELIPAIGAALLALELTGRPVGEAVIATVQESGRALGLVGGGPDENNPK